MNIERFIYYAGRYGSDLSRWPHALRADAGRLLRTSPEAKEAIASEAGLDQLLTASIAITPSAALLERVLAIPSVCSTAFVWVLRPFRPVITLSACAIFGLMIGLSDQAFTHSADTMQELLGPDEFEEIQL